MTRSADDKRARFLEAQQHSPGVPASTTLGATDRQSGAAEVGTCRHKPGVVGFDSRLPALGRQPGGRVWASHNGQVCSKALSPDLYSAHAHMSIDHILETVAKYFQITTEDIRGRSRVQKISVPRKLACYIIRKMMPLLSYEDIANDLGLRDHSTILYYVKDVNRKIKTDPILMSYLAKIVDELGLDSCQKELLTPSADAISDTVDK